MSQEGLIQRTKFVTDRLVNPPLSHTIIRSVPSILLLLSERRSVILLVADLVSSITSVHSKR